MGNEYYLQNGYSGNSMCWWAKDCKGYTTDIKNAHVFTKEEAFKQHNSREADYPWPKGYIDARISHHVSAHDCKRSEVTAQFIITP